MRLRTRGKGFLRSLMLLFGSIPTLEGSIGGICPSGIRGRKATATSYLKRLAYPSTKTARLHMRQARSRGSSVRLWPSPASAEGGPGNWLPIKTASEGRIANVSSGADRADLQHPPRPALQPHKASADSRSALRCSRWSRRS